MSILYSEGRLPEVSHAMSYLRNLRTRASICESESFDEERVCAATRSARCFSERRFLDVSDVDSFTGREPAEGFSGACFLVAFLVDRVPFRLFVGLLAGFPARARSRASISSIHGFARFPTFRARRTTEPD